ncbi:MAG: hypothetical protein RBS80_09190 [Thermoguttaceae bacterium]|jgi:hypothetical protein|nr:hypothetical protein [Thermoguttaceae bacterium]
METSGWQDDKYAEIYEAACTMVRDRRRAEPGFTLDTLRGLLRTAYASEAAGWLGKTTLEVISDSATIAAYEAMLHEWQQELEQ